MQTELHDNVFTACPGHFLGASFCSSCCAEGTTVQRGKISPVVCSLVRRRRIRGARLLHQRPVQTRADVCCDRDCLKHEVTFYGHPCPSYAKTQYLCEWPKVLPFAEAGIPQSLGNRVVWRVVARGGVWIGVVCKVQASLCYSPTRTGPSRHLRASSIGALESRAKPP